MANGITIQIIEEFGNIPEIEGNTDQLQQVFVNLIFNAVDAIPNNGSITFRTKYDIDLENIIVEVIDTGVGMTKGGSKTLPRTFLFHER